MTPQTNAQADASADRTLIIVYAFDELQEVAHAWRTYRQDDGWTVEVVSVPTLVDIAQQIESTDPRATLIQRHIRRRVAVARARGVQPHDIAVLLLGDVVGPNGQPGIPAWYTPQTDPDLAPAWSREPADQCSDVPYQQLDDGDSLPDIMLGRVPAQTAAQASAVLAKIQRYENESPGGPWRRRITYLASPGRFGPQLDRLLEGMFRQMVERVVPYTFDVNMTYASANSPYCAAPSQFNDVVMDRLNEGALLVNYVGHGAATRLDHLYWREESYPICDCADVERDLGRDNARLPIMVIIACSAGRFDMKGARESLSESLLFHPGGPVGVIAGSRITHPYPNAIFQKDVTEQLCRARRPLLGEVDLFASRAMLQLDEEDLKMEWLIATPLARGMGWATSPADLRDMHVGLYNLLGDPTTRIAYPADEVRDLAMDASAVSGRVDPSLEGAVVYVTLESLRTEFPFEDRMTEVAGADDPQLEAKARQNYPLANKKVVAHSIGSVDADGTFRVTWPDPEATQIAASRWVKVYVSDRDRRRDAFGALRLVDDAPDVGTNDR